MGKHEVEAAAAKHASPEVPLLGSAQHVRLLCRSVQHNIVQNNLSLDVSGRSHSAVLVQASEVALDVPGEDSEEERPSAVPSPRRWQHTEHVAPRHQVSAGKGPSLEQLPGRTKSCGQV